MKETIQKYWAPAASGIVAGVVIGLIVNSMWPNEAVSPTPVEKDTSAVVASSTDLVSPTLSTVYNTIADPKAVITVSSQKAGFAVAVTAVDVSMPTWVAVREVVGTTVGNILGANLIQDSAKTFNVDLVRATEANKQYQLYLYQDDGDGIFDLKRDLLITKDRNPLSAGFLTE